MLKTRLQKAEREAKRLRDQQMDALCNRMTGDQRLVVAAALTADLLADEDWIMRPVERERMTTKLREYEAEICQREAAEPGFGQRVRDELDQIDYPPGFDGGW